MPEQSRRRFLATSLKATAATAVVGGPAQYLLNPPQAFAKDIQFAEDSLSHKSDSARRILVAYASKFGSTGGVAAAIAESLFAKGNSVDLKRMEHVDSLQEYDGFVLGGAIHYDHWMDEAQGFVEANHTTLAEHPVACFFTCLTLSREHDKGQKTAAGYADKVSALFPHVESEQVGRFAGALDYGNMSLIPSIAKRGMLGVLGVHEGDYRDWDAIQRWADKSATILAQEISR